MQVNIWSPQELVNYAKDRYTNASIDVTLAGYGNVPYHKTLAGVVHLIEQGHGCAPLPALKKSDSSRGGDFALIFRTQAANCDWVTMSRFVEMAGYKVAMIVYEKDRVDDLEVFDSGFGATINIPTVILKRTDGEEFEAILKKEDSKKPSVSVSLTFSMPHAPIVEYHLWLSAANQNAYEFVTKFKNFHLLFGDRVKIVPHYVLWYCFICQFDGFNGLIPNDNCLSGGEFCAPDPDGELKATGKDVVLEDLRQLCVYNSNPAKWWDYMAGYYKQCGGNITEDSKECADRVLTQIGYIPENVDECIKRDFEGQDFKKTNEILKKERDAFVKAKVPFWPAIIINHQTYRGNMEDMESVFDAICSGFDEEPRICETYYNPITPSMGANYTWVAIIIILLLVGFFIIMICLYKRMIRKELTVQMETQISTIVAQYYSMPNEKKEPELVVGQPNV